MKFETERLILRPWNENDAVSLFEYAKDPLVGPIAGWPVHTSIENSLDIIKNVLSNPETFAICLKKDNKAIGSIGLIRPMQSHTAAKDDEIEVGYWIGVPFWGNGYVPEAVRRIQEYAFSELKVSGMWCGYYDGNEKSKHCQEKCGFEYHHTEENKPCTLMGDVRTEHFTYLSFDKWNVITHKSNKKAILYVHGKGGNAQEADSYKKMFPIYDVYGLDYKTWTPWETKEEFQAFCKLLEKNYESVLLIAGSIGAFFSMNSGMEEIFKSKLEKAIFISPIVDMEKLISDMMIWANVSEQKLIEEQNIATDFGETLSWEYLTYVRKNPITWKTKTYVLYGEKDNLTSRETIENFVQIHNGHLTVMKDGEHWFHTNEQVKFLNDWLVYIR